MVLDVLRTTRNHHLFWFLMELFKLSKYARMPKIVFPRWFYIKIIIFVDGQIEIFWDNESNFWFLFSCKTYLKLKKIHFFMKCIILKWKWKCEKCIILKWKCLKQNLNNFPVHSNEIVFKMHSFQNISFQKKKITK